jgi:hypothetical protein
MVGIPGWGRIVKCLFVYERQIYIYEHPYIATLGVVSVSPVRAIEVCQDDGMERDPMVFICYTESTKENMFF